MTVCGHLQPPLARTGSRTHMLPLVLFCMALFAAEGRQWTNENRVDLSEQRRTGNFRSAFMMMTPHNCAEDRSCMIFYDFWKSVTSSYERTFFMHCSSASGIDTEVDGGCGGDVLEPIFLEWTKNWVWEQYSGGQSLHALHDHVSESVTGFVHENRRWLNTYESSSDMFTQNIASWTGYFSELVGEPCKVLEIGSYEGIATMWLVDHVLTHPDARIVTVDPFSDDALQNTGLDDATSGSEQRRRFDSNVERCASPEKIRSFHGTSEDFYYGKNNALATERGSYDAIYIDGGHTSAIALLDAVSCWTLLKEGGFIIYDDYGPGYSETKSDMEQHMLPSTAFDAFIACHAPGLVVLHKGNQLVLQKKRAGETVADKTHASGDDKDDWGILDGEWGDDSGFADGGWGDDWVSMASMFKDV